jgi:hypothetical protein
MSNFQHKAGNGSLFKNEKKENDSQPDYTGLCTGTDGNFYRLSAWVKTSEKGKKFLSFTLKPIENKTEEKPQPAELTEQPADDLPF